MTIFDSSWGGALFALVACVGLAIWIWFALPPLLRWYYSSYAVTSRRVLFRRGVVKSRYEQVDLLGMANAVTDRSGLDVVFGSGTINLGGGRVMKRIPRVVRIERLISQLAANQTKDAQTTIQLLRSMGYTRLTTK